MALTNLATVNQILNTVAAEVGIQPLADPYSSQDPNFIRMLELLNTAGEELVLAYEWEFLRGEHQITTLAGVNQYALPTDFLSMVNQTGWDQSENVPLGGPLSAQDWTYLKGRDLAQNTLYASFRIADGVFNLYPDPPPAGLDITFEYRSNAWLMETGTPPTRLTRTTSGSNTVMYNRTLFSRFVKVKWLGSTGFDTREAQQDFNQVFAMVTEKDKGAPILNAGRNQRGYPYISTFYNTPDTGFGL